MKIYFDGACRPNSGGSEPGLIQTMVVARGVAHHRRDHGRGDNSDAEWKALLHAIEVARALDVADVTLLGDSVLAVNQASGRAACRGERFASYLAAFEAATAGFGRVRVRHVRRAQNLAGIALERARDADTARAAMAGAPGLAAGEG